MSTQSVRRHISVLQRLVDPLTRGRRQEVDDPRSRSWARAVKSFDEVPARYRPFFECLEPHQQEPFPYAVLTPTYKGDRHTEAEHLLCILDGCVHVLDFTDGRQRMRRYFPSGVSYLERASILLHAWIAIHGTDQDGAFCSTTVRFSSVGDYMMAPFVECLRPAVSPTTEAELEAERSRFSYLTSTHFKFMSYGESSILPGDKVEKILLQPQIRTELVQLFGFSLSRLNCPAHLAILTQRELILIRDDESQRWIKGPSHGAIWTYIPRGKIIDAAVTPTEDDRQILSIGVPGEARIETLFEASQEPQLEQLLSQLRLRTVA